MKRTTVASLAALTFALGVAAAPAPPEAPYREGTVWQLTFVKVKPGMADDYLKGLGSTWKRGLDEAKKQGLVLSYKVLSAPAASRDDWDLMLMIEGKNWATLDGLDAKMRAIYAQVVGTEDKQKEMMVKRLDIREILGEKTAQELVLK